MSLLNKYQNLKIKNKLIISLSFMFSIFSLILSLLYYYFDKTNDIIETRGVLIEKYSNLNMNFETDSVQYYISESIISLTIDDDKWKNTIIPAKRNIAVLGNYIKSHNDSVNYQKAVKSLDNIIDIYENSIVEKITSTKDLIVDSTYTDLEMNQVFVELSREINLNFINLQRSIFLIKNETFQILIESNKNTESLRAKFGFILLISISLFLVFLLLFYQLFKNKVITHIENLIEILTQISIGNISEKIIVKSNDEIGKISQAIQYLLSGLNSITVFAKEIEKGNFDTQIKPRSAKDELGIALIDMKASLLESKKKEIENQKEEEKRSWAANEITKYGDILRKNNNDMSKLADAVIQNLINTVNATQGGLFVLNDEDEKNLSLDLIASYAYDRKKFHTKNIMIGEGLVGTCAIEKDTIYLKEIPDDYIEIISGLGTASPRFLVIVPLKLENTVLGVVELASFYEFEAHKIEFLEKVAENIASTIANTKINAKTALLLAQSQQQAEELASQEEEMRQNMEELQATQEEAARQASELQGVFDAINENTGTIEFSPQGLILDANEFILKLLKLKLSLIDKKHHNMIVPPEEKDTDEFYDFWQDIRAGETKVVTRRYFVSQQEIWLHETFKPLYDTNGNLYKVLAMYNNITESEVQKKTLEKQAEELMEYQNKMKINQEELKNTNRTLEAREKIMQKALEKAKKIEEELNEKNTQMEAQEAELFANLEQIAVAQEESEKETTRLNKELKTLRAEKKKIENEFKLLSEKFTLLENELNELKRK